MIVITLLSLAMNADMVRSLVSDYCKSPFDASRDTRVQYLVEGSVPLL